MKVYICTFSGWEHTDIMRIYKDELSAQIWKRQIDERISKKQEIEEKDFGEWMDDASPLEGRFKYEEYDVI